ncbi:hypothetical protein V501_00316 [Pseudogymnoascus sp. VKM F-4519 (FW-2642)]|nr:hypothetical protein V501_00316 [Pseudogymnoascus sp. VKM F-4519 (FW-2642)]
MSEARASASPRASPKGDTGEQPVAQWACTICRARKPTASTYKDMVERLAKMEGVVKEFSRSKVSTPPSNEVEAEPNLHIALMSEGTSPNRLFEPVFESDEFVGPAAAQVPENSLSAPTGLEPPLNHNGAAVVDNELEIEYTGPSFIFSLQGILWVNELVGDDCFGRAVAASLTPTSLPHNRGNVGISAIHPLPSKSVTIDCANGNYVDHARVAQKLTKAEIMDGIERYYSTGISPSRGWFTAINVILGHALRKRSDMENSVESEKYIGNAMSMIPSIMMSKPNQLNTGAMLSMTAYFMLLCENQTAIMILAAAIQSMVLCGYDNPRRRPGQTDEDKLLERRLFWQAFVFDHDLALQIGKPPMIGPDFIIDLRDDLPEDGTGTVSFDNGVTLNILREHVSLALIKRKAYSLLYAKDAVTRRDDEVVKIISDLDFELYSWKLHIPEITKSDRPEQDEKDFGLMSLTMMHYNYYQLIIVVHSFIFQCSNLVESDDNFGNILSSVALCVGAARATVSLLDFHEDRHPFSMFLLNNISWSLDIIFINILQNKGTISAREDLNLLGRIVSLFKKYYPNYTHSISFRTAKVFYQVAWKALQNHAFYQTPPPNNVPPPPDVPLYNAWDRHLQAKVVPGNTSAYNALEPSTQIRFYNQQTVTQSTLPSDQQGITSPFSLRTNEQFHNLGLDNNTSNNMVWSSNDQRGPNAEFRLSLGLDPQYWQGLWTTAAEWEGNTN